MYGQWLKKVVINMSAFFIICLSFIRPKQVFARDHDYLDHFFVLQKLWSEQVPFFNYSVRIQGVLDNINANALGFADLNFTLIIGKFLDPVSTFVITEISLRFIGFIGFYGLIKEIRNGRDSKILYLGALLFSSLDLIPTYQPTVFLTPTLLLLLFRTLNNRINPAYYLMVFIIWQWMGLIYGGYALLFFFTLLPFKYFDKRYVNVKRFYKFLIWNLFSAGFASHRLIIWQIQSKGEIHRADWPKQVDSNAWILDSTKDFIQAISLPYLSGGNIALITIWILIYCILRSRQINTKSNYLKFSLMYLVSIYLLIIIDNSKILAGMGIFFQLNRVSVFLSLVVIFLLTIKSCELSDTKFWKLGNKPFIAMVATVTFIFPQHYNLLRNNLIDGVSNSQTILTMIASKTNSSIGGTDTIATKIQSRKAVTILEKFQVEEYADLREQIESSSSMPGVLSVGLDPMIAAFNGFRSYDGYVFNYEMSYKRKFRPIIQKVLHKDLILRDYFDSWGNRVYAFTKPGGVHSLDLCYANNIGVEFVLFRQGEVMDSRIRSVGMSGDLAVGRIICE